MTRETELAIRRLNVEGPLQHELRDLIEYIGEEKARRIAVMARPGSGAWISSETFSAFNESVSAFRGMFGMTSEYRGAINLLTRIYPAR